MPKRSHGFQKEESCEPAQVEGFAEEVGPSKGGRKSAEVTLAHRTFMGRGVRGRTGGTEEVSCALASSWTRLPEGLSIRQRDTSG